MTERFDISSIDDLELRGYNPDRKYAKFMEDGF